jgi:hypothetical protein
MYIVVHQHDLGYIEKVLARVGEHLLTPITAYHIGGNAMCVLKLKPTTKDTKSCFCKRTGDYGLQGCVV